MHSASVSTNKTTILVKQMVVKVSLKFLLFSNPIPSRQSSAGFFNFRCQTRCHELEEIAPLCPSPEPIIENDNSEQTLKENVTFEEKGVRKDQLYFLTASLKYAIISAFLKMQYFIEMKIF